MATTEPNEIFDDPQDIYEVLNFPAGLLAELPFPPIAVLEVAGFDISILFDFRPRKATRRKFENRHVVFDHEEINYLIESVEQDRSGKRGFFQLLQRKTVSPGWRLTREVALAGTSIAHSKPRNWSLGCVLETLGAELCMIQIVNQQPSQQNSNTEATR